MDKQEYIKCKHGKREVEHFPSEKQAELKSLGVNAIRCSNCNTWFYHPDVSIKK